MAASGLRICLLLLSALSLLAAAARSPLRQCSHPVTSVRWLRDGADPQRVAERSGSVLVGRVGELPGNVYEFAVGCADDEGGDHDRAVAKLSARPRPPDPDVIRESVQRKKQQHPRPDPRAAPAASADGYVAQNWHLTDDTAAGARVLGAWALGCFGRGANISIVDDGVFWPHADISRGYDRRASANFNSGDPSDAGPTGDQSHGTGAAGVAGASGASPPPGAPECVHGVAPEATLIGARLIAEPATAAAEARALTLDLGTVDVYSCSWGPYDDGATLDGPDDVVRSALDQGAARGANYVWAAGNGYANGDTCAHDGYASSPRAMAVAAVTHLGRAAWYSEACEAMFVSAPSSGDGRSISTADIVGRRGSSSGDCNAGFGGTSAAAPFVAGVVALLRSANPALSPADRERVIAATARVIDASNPSWRRNSAGVWHSARYGFGLVDAEAAVRLARSYAAPGGEEAECAAAADRADRVARPSGCPVRTVERVAAEVTASPAPGRRRGSMRFVLTSPSGSQSVFEGRPYDDSLDGYDAWPFYSVAHWGERLDDGGSWTLAETAGAARAGWSWTLRVVGPTRQQQQQ